MWPTRISPANCSNQSRFAPSALCAGRPPYPPNMKPTFFSEDIQVASTHRRYCIKPQTSSEPTSSRRSLRRVPAHAHFCTHNRWNTPPGRSLRRRLLLRGVRSKHPDHINGKSTRIFPRKTTRNGIPRAQRLPWGT